MRFDDWWEKKRESASAHLAWGVVLGQKVKDPKTAVLAGAATGFLWEVGTDIFSGGSWKMEPLDILPVVTGSLIGAIGSWLFRKKKKRPSSD